MSGECCAVVEMKMCTSGGVEVNDHIHEIGQSEPRYFEPLLPTLPSFLFILCRSRASLPLSFFNMVNIQFNQEGVTTVYDLS